MVLCDGYRLIAVHAALGHALDAAPVPAEHAPVRELVFAGEDALVTAGRHGGLVFDKVKRSRVGEENGSHVAPIVARWDLLTSS